MAQPPFDRKVTFAEMAFKGRLKIIMPALAALGALLLVAGMLLASDAPPSYSGTGQVNDVVGLAVKESTEQPIDLIISHTFQLVPYGSSGFDVAPGEAYVIGFNLSVRDVSGQTVWRNDSFLMTPLTHKFSDFASSDTATVQKSYQVTLSPGKYSVLIVADHPVDYRIEQKYKAQAMQWALLGAGALCMILVAAMAIYSFRKANALNRARMREILSSAQSPVGAHPQQQYAPPAPVPVYYPAVPAQPTPEPGYAGGRGQSPEEAARHSSLEYVPGGLYVEVVCPRCGWPVRSRPENGYVRCEHCGEVGYVQ